MKILLKLSVASRGELSILKEQSRSSFARYRIRERGAKIEEVMATVECGESFPAKHGRTGFRRNFPFNSERLGRYYNTKQVEVYAVQEIDAWLVVTVLTRFF